jgi:prevent-host-death family protein
MSRAVKPISYVKAHAAKIVDEVAKSHEPVVITQNGEAKAVIQSLDDYEKMQDSLAMLKIIALGRKSVAEGKTKDMRKAFRDMRRKVTARRKGPNA